MRRFGLAAAVLWGAMWSSGCNCNSAKEAPLPETINAYDCACTCGIVLPGFDKSATFSVCLPSPLTVPAGGVAELKPILEADCKSRVCANAGNAIAALTNGKPSGFCISCKGAVPVVHGFNVATCNSCQAIACDADAGNVCPFKTLAGADAGSLAVPDGRKCCTTVESDPTGCIGAAGTAVPTVPVCMAAAADPLGAVPQNGLFAYENSDRSIGDLDPTRSTLVLTPNNDAKRRVQSPLSGQVDFVGRFEGGHVGLSIRAIVDTSPLHFVVNIPVVILGVPASVPYDMDIEEGSLVATSAPDALDLSTGVLASDDFAGWMRARTRVHSGVPLAPGQGTSDRAFILQPTRAMVANIDPATGEFEILGSVTVAQDAANSTPDFTGSLVLRGTLKNRPPIAVAGPSQTVECTSPAGATIHLNGSASSDPDNNITDFSWHQGATNTSPVVASESVTTLTQPVGSTRYTLSVSDSFFQTSSSSTTVEVTSSSPPTIQSATVTPGCLWPPNHKFVRFDVGAGLQVAAASVCDSSKPTVEIVDVKSSEAPLASGSGATSPDVFFSSGAVCLRSERSGTGHGRTYTITLRATDRFGHSATRDVTVDVGHDQGQGGACTDIDPADFIEDGDVRCSSLAIAPATPRAAQDEGNHPRGGGCASGGGDAVPPAFALLALLMFLRLNRTLGSR